MSRIKQWLGFSLGFLAMFASDRAFALPGQTVSEAITWIKINPTLEPTNGETLMVRRSDTSAHRFTFEAQTTPPGWATTAPSQGTIRNEKITLFDSVNGVSRSRLEESFRIIYGSDLYQDYEQANVIYQYPMPNSVPNSQAENQNAPLQNAPLRALVRGEIRQGKQFAYWVETAQTSSGTAYSGQFSIFLIEDIGKLEGELQRR